MFVNYFCVWNNIILCYERENITVRYFCGYQHSIVSENGGLIIWWNFVHYIFFEPSRNERGEIDECIGCNVKDCYDIYGDGTNEKCKWKDLIDKEAEEMKDDN